MIKLWTTWADVDNSRRTRSGGPELSVRRAMLKLGVPLVRARVERQPSPAPATIARTRPPRRRNSRMTSNQGRAYPIDTPDDSDTYGVPDTYGVSDAKGFPSHSAGPRIDPGTHESQPSSRGAGVTWESARTAGGPPAVPPNHHAHHLRFHSLNLDSIYVFKRHCRRPRVDVRAPALPATSSPGHPAAPQPHG